jgi:hypothetical protein
MLPYGRVVGKSDISCLKSSNLQKAAFTTTCRDTSWADRVPLVDAIYAGPWELPAIGAVSAPTALLIRPDGYVAWVGDQTQMGLADALTTWFGQPRAASASSSAPFET